MATTVVPIPESFSSSRPAARILRFASLMASLKVLSGWRSLSTSMARELATSPASNPPMPSATTKSVSSSPSPTSMESSLFCLTLPASVSPNGCSSRKGTRLLLVPERGRADPYGVPASKGRCPHGLASVDEGPVGRAEVLDVEQTPVPGQLRVASRGVVVALQNDAAAGGASHARLAVGDLEAGLWRQNLGVLDDKLWGARDGPAWPVGPTAVALPTLARHVGLIVRDLPEIPYAPAHHGVDKGEEQKQEQGFGREKRH